MFFLNHIFRRIIDSLSRWQFINLKVFFLSFLFTDSFSFSPFIQFSLFADATLTHEVEKFVSNESLLNPDIDTSVTIFGRHSGEGNCDKGLSFFDPFLDV